MAQPGQRSPIPLAYQPPMPQAAGSAGIWFGYLILASSAAGILSIACLAIVPKFEAIFKDFKVTLPPATMLLLLFARWFRQYGWAIVWVSALGAALAMAAATWQSPAAWRTFRIIHRIFWILFVLLFAFGAWALYAPMLNLVTAASGK